MEGATATANGISVQELEQLRSQVASLQAEVARRERNDARVAGMQQLVEAAGSLGLSKPEDFDALRGRLEILNRIEKGGLNLKAIDNPPAPSGGNQPLDLEALVEKVVQRISPVVNTPFAIQQHEAAERRMMEQVSSLVEQLAGGDEKRKKFLERHVQNELVNIRDFYPEDHPLHASHLRPLDDSGVGKLREAVSGFSELFDATKAAATGDAARKAAQKHSEGGNAGAGARGADPTPGSGVSKPGAPGQTPPASDQQDATGLRTKLDDVRQRAVEQLEGMLAAERGDTPAA